MSQSPRGHRLVRADAGTGKTYSLTARYLELIGAGVEPARLLAVTFTRKAAAEILERILQRLATAAIDEEERRRLSQELGRELVRSEIELWLARVVGDLHRLSVSTLDSFFHRVVRCFRFELGLHRINSVAAAADPELRDLRQGALEATLDELAAADLEALVELLGRFYRGDAARSVAATLDRVLLELYGRFREQPEEAAWTRLEVPSGRLDVAALDRATDRLADYAAGCRIRALYSGLANDVAQAVAGDWLGFVKDGLAAKLAQDPSQATYRRKAIPADLADLYRPLLDHAATQLLDLQARQTAATQRLLAVFDRHFERARSKAGVVLFGDLVSKIARELPALGDELLLQVYYRLDARVQHLLLDEFQDTSREQWQALLPLVEEVLAYGDGSRSLFVVGDPKQAIYGWRGGCAELFDLLEARFETSGLATSTLRRSYRSSPVVLEAANRVFSRLGEWARAQPPALEPAIEHWRSRFAPHLAACEQQPGLVRLLTSPQWEGAFDDESELDRHLDEEIEVGEALPDLPPRPLGHLAFAAERVAEIAARRPSASVAVLVQTNRTVAEMLDRLRDCGLEASGEGGSPIADDPAVLVILSALVLADHPADSAALHHVATSPLYPVLLAESGDPSPSGSRRRASGSRLARSLRRALARHGLAATLSRWARHLAPKADRRGAIRLAQLVELADVRGSEMLPGDFVELVEAIRLEEPLPSAVRVMTVHQAKGLEFDAVLLCELERRLGALNNPLAEVERSHPAGPVEAVYRGTNATVRQFSQQLQLAHQQEIERRVGDDLSALYVAMTRARSELHVVIQPRQRTASGKLAREQPTGASILRWGLAAELGAEQHAQGSTVLCEIGEEIVDVDLEPAAVAEEALPSPPAGEEAPAPAAAAFRPPSRRRRRLLPTAGPSQLAVGPVRGSDLLSLESGSERARGRLLHLWLEQLEWLDETWPRREILRDLAERRGLARGRRRIEDLLDELEDLVRQDPIAELLRRPPTRPGEQVQLWRERPYAVEVDGRIERGVLDRAMIYRHGGVSVGAELIDFKSDRIGLDELEPTVERYRPQLESYRLALARLIGVLPTAVSCRLALLGLGRVVSV